MRKTYIYLHVKGVHTYEDYRAALNTSKDDFYGAPPASFAREISLSWHSESRYKFLYSTTIILQNTRSLYRRIPRQFVLLEPIEQISQFSKKIEFCFLIEMETNRPGTLLIHEKNYRPYTPLKTKPNKNIYLRVKEM